VDREGEWRAAWGGGAGETGRGKREDEETWKLIFIFSTCRIDDTN